MGARPPINSIFPSSSAARAHVDGKLAALTRFVAANPQRLEFVRSAAGIERISRAGKHIGVDHVGLSSDFNHGGGVLGFSNVGEAANVTAELLKRGYREQDIDKLWGANFLRVLKQAERVGGQYRQARIAFGP